MNWRIILCIGTIDCLTTAAAYSAIWQEDRERLFLFSCGLNIWRKIAEYAPLANPWHLYESYETTTQTIQFVYFLFSWRVTYS
jgi:hypothetical protein